MCVAACVAVFVAVYVAVCVAACCSVFKVPLVLVVELLVFSVKFIEKYHMYINKE